MQYGMIDLAPQMFWGQPVIIGAGLAGAVAALTLAPRPVVLLDGGTVGATGSSCWAQGGVAAAVGPEDSVAIHAADTVAAGAGLAEAEIARQITAAGPETIAALERFGVRFDRAADGTLACGLEAAHSHRRILHVRDATGAAIMRALAERIAATPSIRPLAGTALRLVVDDRGVAGLVLRLDERPVLLPTRAVVLATGGVGALWRSTTNPAASLGRGLVLAARAGAALADLEFVQFHPTALAAGVDPMPLISEAVRGEGAFLIDQDGQRLMAGIPGGDLAPRDILARAVFACWQAGGRAALDARHWAPGAFQARFPSIHHVLAGQGIDPARDPIPVRPAAHYHMGGVKAAANGRTGLAGLWASGEVAATGLHGANRLASNSLLEAAVCGRLAAEDIAGIGPQPVEMRPLDIADLPAPGLGPRFAEMRDLMDSRVGVVRDAAGLAGALDRLAALRAGAGHTDFADALAAAVLVTLAAERRVERRGAHWRADAEPATGPGRHATLTWADLAPLGF